jgi:hypothetical protein
MTEKTQRRIACLGWGSLIERSGCLATLGAWLTDGPRLPVEFARESNDGRITLVICPPVARVPTQWILLNHTDVQAAAENLGRREYAEATPKWTTQSIGWWDREAAKHYGMESKTIAAWAAEHQLDGVVWTNLPCGFKGSRGRMPSGDEVLAHLRGLDAAALDKAKEYVRTAPAEVDTAYRRRIAAHFGWN